MTISNHPRDEKIQTEHLQRAAYVYVRQSSPHQVEHHQESRRRQYALVAWAEQAGWARSRITVVDQDQGRTATVAHSRDGFEQMAAAVGRGEVGIVIGLEVARLARNSPDWHHLMYLCRWTRTLIADEHAVYDLSLNSDRMVLGLRGQLSELEIDNSIHRMVQARWSKARRGEVMTIPPAGYEIDDDGQFVLTSDEAIAHAIRTVFAKFDELGTGRGVWVWWREQGLKLPVRRIEPRSHPVVWVEPSYRIILNILHHPIYAGAYVFGRSETVRKIDPGDGRTLRVRRMTRERATWPVLIEDHHPAYIAFEKYLHNQDRMLGNKMMRVDNDEGRHRGAAREGRALLQGLVRCGRCGRPMLVSYGGSRGGIKGRTMQYRCRGARPMTGAPECQLVGGKRIDQAVVEAFLEASCPAAVDALARVEESIHHHNEAAERAFELQIEKAHSCLGHVYLVAQEWKRALDALEEERRLRGDIYDPYGKSWPLQGLAAAHLGLGRSQEALGLAEEAVGLASEHRWPYPETVASLTLSRVLRSVHGRAAAERIIDLAARVESIIAVTGMVALRPLVEVERAELAGLLDDSRGRRGKLEEARRLFVAMGAMGHAERVDAELSR